MLPKCEELGNVREPQCTTSTLCCALHMKVEVHNFPEAQNDEKNEKHDASRRMSYHA